MSTNPVFNRIDRESQQGYVGFEPSRDGTQAVAPAYGAQAQISVQDLEQRYRQPSAGPVETGRVSMDDIIMKTAGLFAIVLTFAAVGWYAAAQSQATGTILLLGGIVVTIGLGFAIALKKTISVPLIVTYAVVEGLFVGAVSQIYQDAFGEGIVPQAVLATLGVFAGMLVLYRTGLIKVTDRFRRTMTMAIFGYFIFAIVNFLFAMFTDSPFGLGGTGWLGIGISIFATGLAAFTLALDFDSIERAIATGAPERYSWLLAHGLIVTIVWLYLEMLRLLARLRE